MVSVENIFAAGAAVIAGRQLGASDTEGANRTVTTIIGFSFAVGIALCILGIVFMEPLLEAFGSIAAVMPQAKDYAFWMFIAALFNLPAQSMNYATRANLQVKISSIAVITGAVLNVVLDPVFHVYLGIEYGCGRSISCDYRLSMCNIPDPVFLLYERKIDHQNPTQIFQIEFFISLVCYFNRHSYGSDTDPVSRVATSLTNMATKIFGRC